MAFSAMVISTLVSNVLFVYDLQDLYDSGCVSLSHKNH